MEKPNTGPLYRGLGMRQHNCSGAVDYLTYLDNTDELTNPGNQDYAEIPAVSFSMWQQLLKIPLVLP